MERLAAEAEVGLHVSFSPTHRGSTKNEVELTVQKIINAAKGAIGQGHEVRLDDGVISVQLSGCWSAGEVNFASWLADSNDLGEQAKDLMRSVVKPKIERQLNPYRNRGHKTALLLDLRPDLSKGQVPFFLASEDTVRFAISEVSAEFLFVPDSAFLISQTGVVTRLW